MEFASFDVGSSAKRALMSNVAATVPKRGTAESFLDLTPRVGEAIHLSEDPCRI
jgi:hypothetical protein